MNGGIRQIIKSYGQANLYGFASNQALPIPSFFATLHSSKYGKPKKPANSYLLFLKEQHRDGNLSTTQFTISVAQRWRTMSPVEKQPFVDQHKELASQYRKDLEAFYSSLTATERAEYLDEFRQNKLKRQKRIHKKEKKLTYPPKRGRSAWNYFIKSRFNAVRVDSLREAADVLKDATALWNSMIPEQKQPFVMKAREDKERYAREMERYVQRMQREEKTHLLPSKYQKIAERRS